MLKTFLIEILTLSFICLPIYGEVLSSQNTTYIIKGTPAPYTGYLFTPPAAQDIRIRLMNASDTELINASLQKSNSLETDITTQCQTKLAVYVKEDNTLAKDLESARKTSDLTKALWFFAGVALVGFSAYVIHKVQ